MNIITKERKIEILNKIYRKPNDEITKKLLESKEKIILIYGDNETGKTVTLYNVEDRSVNTKNISIYVGFVTPRNLNEQFLTHYLELTLAKYLLNYIKDNYPQIMDSFKEIERSLLKEEKFFKTGEITLPLIIKLKRILNVDSLTILIDNFNKDSGLLSEFLTRYFNLFDKVILSSKLPNNNYLSVNINYGNSLDIVKEIFKQKISDYDLKSNITDRIFPYEQINENIYNYIIKKSNGNIGILIRTLYSVYYNWTWEDMDFNLEDEFKLYINEQLSLTHKKF